MANNGHPCIGQLLDVFFACSIATVRASRFSDVDDQSEVASGGKLACISLMSVYGVYSALTADALEIYDPLQSLFRRSGLSEPLSTSYH
jgi:hypothetical protein